jgi:hypothetical protein
VLEAERTGAAAEAPGTAAAGFPPVQSPMDALKASRGELLAEHVRLDASRARLAEAGERQKAATEALTAIGEAESSEMSAWALAGSVGPPPAPKAEDRAKLNLELEAASATASAASGAVVDIEHRMAKIAAEVAELDSQIEGEAILALEAEAAGYGGEAEHLAARLSSSLARVAGLRVFFTQRGRQLFDNGEVERCKAFYGSASRLGFEPADGGEDDNE